MKSCYQRGGIDSTHHFRSTKMKKKNTEMFYTHQFFTRWFYRFIEYPLIRQKLVVYLQYLLFVNGFL